VLRVSPRFSAILLISNAFESLISPGNLAGFL
jgi:hypothetical protein